MKKTLLVFSLVLLMGFVKAETIGTVDYDKIIDNYSIVKSSTDEFSDRLAELQRYKLDKAREYKKLTTPLERKNFQEAIERELEKKEEAYARLMAKKEAEIDTAIRNAVRQAAIENKIDTVIEQSVLFFGGVDITDKVIKILNVPKQ